MLRSSTIFDENGHPSYDPLTRYVITDGPSEAQMNDDIKYWLGVAPDGSWLIRKETSSTGTQRFASGRSDYVSAWADKLSQTYDRTDKIF